MSDLATKLTEAAFHATAFDIAQAGIAVLRK